MIVIIVESLETAFLKIEDGGAFSEDLIPEITALAKNNINFSNNDGIGGAVQVYGTGWTIAGIVSNYSGVPLAFSEINDNSYGRIFGEFMPGASGIGTILNGAGYKNYFILGSKIEFGGRDKYFKTHKDTVIFDYHYFKNNNFIPQDYQVWWGIEDRKLYRFAKDIIADISGEEPFFITLLTADTHFTDGYLDDEAERVFDSKYKNVVRDASRQLSDFFEWLKQQDFYENTTVVILGDHLYMDSSFFPEEYVSSGNREDNSYPINIFINSLLPQENTKNRRFSHFDIFPLLIESIGGVYDAEGLALGRSMTKDGGMTLLEEYGETVMNEQLRKKSSLYNAFWGIKNY